MGFHEKTEDNPKGAGRPPGEPSTKKGIRCPDWLIQEVEKIDPVFNRFVVEAMRYYLRYLNGEGMSTREICNELVKERRD